MALSPSFGITFGVRIDSFIWCEDCSLKESFPELFTWQGIRMLYWLRICLLRMTVHWNMNFIRLVHDWEVESISFVYNALFSVSRS
jgi:hypothetical protein